MPSTNSSPIDPQTTAAERYPLRRGAVYLKRAAEWTRRAEEPGIDAATKATYKQMARDYDGLADDMEGKYASRAWRSPLSKVDGPV